MVEHMFDGSFCVGWQEYRCCTPDVAVLSERQRAVMKAFVSAWESSAPGATHQPFDLGSLPLEHPNWPGDVAVPSREEVRPLVHLGWLESDKRAAPIWRVFPSPAAREVFGGSSDGEAEALADSDRRLGLILEATVAAFEADPTEPIHFAPMQQIDYVSHPHWPLQPDVVRQHDLDQLVDLGLISVRERGRDLAFYPTLSARAATKDVPGYLDRLAREARDENERSRLSKWAKRVRAGDVAVGTVAGTSGALIRALMGM